MSVAALGAFGAIASAGGALFQGVSTSEAASYQAAVERNNAAIANANATRAIAGDSSRLRTRACGMPRPTARA